MSPRRFFPLLTVVFAVALGAEASAPKKEAGPAAGSSEYVDIRPALVANYGGPGPIHYIKAEVTLRVGKNPENGLKVVHHMPRVRHELVMLLSRQTEQNIATMEGKEQLRHDALAALQKAFQEESGQPVVEDLLFTNFIVQR